MKKTFRVKIDTSKIDNELIIQNIFTFPLQDSER